MDVRDYPANVQGKEDLNPSPSQKVRLKRSALNTLRFGIFNEQFHHQTEINVMFPSETGLLPEDSSAAVLTEAAPPKFI